MTERVKRLFNRLMGFALSLKAEKHKKNVRCVPREEYLARALGRFESFFVNVQNVLVWENPLISCMCIVIVNVLFWLALSFQCRFYGVLFTTFLIGFIYNLWMPQIWPETSTPLSETRGGDMTAYSPRILSVPEISHYLSHILSALKNYYIWLKTLRDTQPGLFCCGMCVFFIILTIIGRTVPGLVLSYCFIMILMIGPGIWIHLLHPPSVIQKVRNIHAALHSSHDTDSEVEEYLPEQTGENLALLQLAGEANEEEQHDESLIIAEFGLESADMNTALAPDEGSTDGLDISDFDLSTPPSMHSINNHEPIYHQNNKIEPEASDTDDENVSNEEQIRFQSLHYNRDSSEEEELAFAQGLVFTESKAPPSQTVPVVPTTGLTEMLTSTAVQAVTKNIASLGAMGQSILSTVISGPSQVVVKELIREESSSGESEDFEMISRDDLS